MIKDFEKFKLNEDINPHAMRTCGYYKVDEEQMSFILHDLTLNEIIYTYNPDNNYLEIETFEFQKPYDIILKNGGDKLPFNLEDNDYSRDCVLLRSKPVTCPPGAYM